MKVAEAARKSVEIGYTILISFFLRRKEAAIPLQDKL